MSEGLTYSMKIVALKTGLTPHTIRVWERRYKAISPARTATNRRSYSNEDLRRLILLGKATRAGHSISRIANLPTDRLAALVREEGSDVSVPPQSKQAPPTASAEIRLEEALGAVRSMNAASLESILAKASAALSLPVFFDQLIVPLMARTGELWREGKLRVTQEHMASGVVRTILGDLLRRSPAPASAPGLVAATPAGQLHEAGALLAAATAASEGWRVTYLGPDLPAEEIAGAATLTRARAVALSIIYPADDARLVAEIERLRTVLPDEVTILAGGRSAGNYSRVLEAVGAVLIPDLHSLRIQLERLRAAGPSPGTV